MKQYLRDIADVSAGQGAPQGDSNYCEDGTPFVKAGNLLELTERGSIHNLQKVSEEVAKKHKLKLYKKGTILFAKSGMSCLKGYVYVLPCDAYVVSHLACVTPREDISEYLKYYFCYHKPNQLVKDAAYPSISLSDIGCLEIDLKDTVHRNTVVASLNRLSAIIDIRKQQLVELDNLIKARFVELFGKVETERTLEEISEFVTVGIANSATHAYADSGVVMLRNQNIKENYLDDSDLIYITPDFANKYGTKSLKTNDILVIRTGYPGVACLVPPKYEGCQTFTTLIVRLAKIDEINPVYICHYINSEYGKRFVDGEKVGVAQQNFGAKALAKMPIKIPSKELQEQFCTFAKQIDKSKVVVQKALEEAQLLFDSLMQEYFG